LARNFLTQKAAGFARGKIIRSPSALSDILLRRNIDQPLLFAKISDAITNRTFLLGEYEVGLVFSLKFLMLVTN